MGKPAPAQRAGSPQPGNEPVADPASSEPAATSGGAGRERAKQVDDAQRQLAESTSAAQQARAQGAMDELSGRPTVDAAFGGAAGDAELLASFPGLDGRPVGAYQVAADTITGPHVPATGFDALRAAVGDRRLVIARGADGTGKSAALLHALTGGAGDMIVLRLGSATDLSTLAPSRLPDCHAIVLNDLTAAHLDRLDDDTIDRLSATLLSTNRWLGLTVADDLPITTAVAAVVVEIGDPPSPRAVFEAHLRAGLQSAAERARRLADPDVAQLLAEELTPTTPARRAAQLGQILAQPCDDPSDLVATARARVRGRPKDECLQWFRTLPNLRAHCTALALAVFNGLPREEVTAAADRLIGLIAPTPDRPEPGPAVNPFAPDVDVSLRTLRATTRPGTLIAVEGEIRVTELAYVDPWFPSWVLHNGWANDSARPNVVTWLRELGGHHNQDVRTRAAAAVGALAVQAFEFVFTQIIGPWAQDDDPNLRESAALALALPSQDPELGGVVATIVGNWVGDADTPQRQATAARMFGSSTGLTQPSSALRQLAALAKVDRLVVAIAVARSLGELVVQGSTALAGRVLTDVASWVGGPPPALQLVGRLAFLRLTYLRGAPSTPGNRPDPAYRGVPTLLALALRDQRFVPQLAWLWIDALNAADTHRWAGTSLTAWAEAVEKHPQARDVLVTVLASAATHDRTAAIITRAAQGWRSDAGAARSTADAVLAHLTGVVSHV